MPEHDSTPTQSPVAESPPPAPPPLSGDVCDALAYVAESTSDLAGTLTPEGVVAHVNAAGLRLLGARRLDEVCGRDFHAFVLDEDRAPLDAARQAIVDGPGTWRGECRVRRLDGGAPVHVEVRAAALRAPATGALVAVAVVLRDLAELDTERARLAEQARQAQRVESLGVLAGGVAHDFNNLLTVILSTIDLVRGDLPRTHPVQVDLDVVRGAAARASQLTRQLLARSRRPPAEVRLLDLNAVVADVQGLLRRLVGEEAILDVSLAPQALPVRADAAQLEQVLVNLVLNARDAIAPRGAGGLVTVETGDATLAADAAARAGMPPGRYVSIVVRDSGVGMSDATRRRAFEPFFTTKPVGEGTGLGLAVVSGIVTQAGGTVRVESAPGRGSTFRVLLPRAEAIVGANGGGLAAQPGDSGGTPPRGRETVLLVEDEAGVRGVARRILERAGYTVLEARHGADALLVWREQHGAIDVLLTDVRMPELGGRELAQALRRERPDLPVVFVSGYLQDPVRGSNGRVAESSPPNVGEAERFVAKPFVAPELQRAVRQVLDAGRSAA